MKRAILLLALSLSIIGWTEESENPGQENNRVQCWAVTKSGNRCKRRAAAGKRYCHQHASNVTPKNPPDRCRSMTDAGNQCGEKPIEGKSYCERHMDK